LIFLKLSFWLKNENSQNSQHSLLHERAKERTFVMKSETNLADVPIQDGNDVKERREK